MSSKLVFGSETCSSMSSFLDPIRSSHSIPLCLRNHYRPSLSGTPIFLSKSALSRIRRVSDSADGSRLDLGRLDDLGPLFFVLRPGTGPSLSQLAGSLCTRAIFLQMAGSRLYRPPFLPDFRAQLVSYQRSHLTHI